MSDNELHELVMDLRQATGNPENLHRAFFDILKPRFEAARALATGEHEEWCIGGAKGPCNCKPTTGEWTAERIINDLGLPDKFRDSYAKELAKEITAALADEKKASRYWQEQWVERGAQLAAEQRKHDRELADVVRQYEKKLKANLPNLQI